MSEQAIFLAALDVPPADRAAFLDDACAGDAALRRGVETLLRLHAAPHRFLEVPAVEQLAAAPLDPTDLSFLGPPGEPGSLGRLDQYEALEVVGKGGTGVVLRARDTKLMRVVALKVLAAPLAASGTARQRFAREARAAASVRDDHVVAIHAVRDDAPLPYLVMEYIDGQNLDALLRRGGPLGVPEVLRIGSQVASGLAAAHRLGLVHRDVKPANILLENGVQRVKITDFGLARAADDASLTQTGFIAGTPLYMAPEQAAGEPLDARSDLFSLGSVLYEMCAGRPAFRAPTTVAVIRRVCDEAPRPLREVNPDVPESLCRLIGRLHAKRPADRPASATEVADALAGLLAECSRVSPRRDAQPGLGETGLHRHPWLYAVAALLLLFAGLGVSEATGVTDVRGTVVRLLSPDGTLVVEVDDPGVSVAVDGGDVVITGAGAKEIRLKPGQYQVEASRDGKVVRQELATVTRNGRKVVRISMEGEPRAAIDPWEKAVAGLPPKEQVEAVVKRLKELNPRFDGKVTPTIREGVVTELRFHADEVTDISPVRVLKDLRLLYCYGSSDHRSKLADLTPLRGLHLESLYCHNTRVADLSPLRGMPLVQLNCCNNPVADLSPLQGMRLRHLQFYGTEVADLTPLRGMPLYSLDLCRVSKVTDLRPLVGMQVDYLNLSYLPITDLSLLADMKALRHLILDHMPATDLTPLRGLPLTRLSIRNSRFTDLTPLKGMPLDWLRLDYRADRKEFVKSFPGLQFINEKPVAAFWKEVDGK